MPRRAAQKRTRTTTRNQRPLNEVLAARVREQRVLAGLSQTQLGNVLGCTFQQIQKSEKATNRISAVALVKIAEALHTPISYFLDGLGNPTSESELRRADLELVRAYQHLNSESQQAVRALVRRMAREE
jgi:transcriptional regulator with XRE-family HTH domain